MNLQQQLVAMQATSLLIGELSPGTHKQVPQAHDLSCCICTCTQGQGLSERQMQLCDSFVYIPQYGPGTASLNVAVAASIILHQFAIWAGFEERQREGAKYLVDERGQRTTPRGECMPILLLRLQPRLGGIITAT